MLKMYQLPNGILYVNTDKVVIEHIIDNGVPVTILPKKAYLAGEMRGVPLEEYFACPEIWEAKWDVYEAIERKGSTVVAIDASRVRKFGDQIMLTVLPKAYRENWSGRAEVDLIIPKGYEEIWANNPYVRNVKTKLDSRAEYDNVMDVEGLGLKFRRKEGGKCIDAILNGLGLTLMNKTPVYVVTEEEKKWAKRELEKDKKRGLKTNKGLIGISLLSAVKSRTYPKMIEVARKLGDEGYGLILFDIKDDDGNYMWTFRQMAALVNECDLIVTADSSILHLAGAFKKRVIGIFGYTEGHIFTESYEKASIIQAPCPLGKEPCWWEIECLPGHDHMAKTDSDYAHCLKELDPYSVVEKVEEVFEKPKKLLLVMLTYNALDMTKKAIEGIRSWHDYELFVIDNESTDGTQEWLMEEGIEFVSERTPASVAQSTGVKKFLEGNYDYLMIMNNDIILKYDTIDALVECIEKSGAYGVMSTPTDCRWWQIDSLRPADDGWTEVIDIPAGSYSATLFSRECMENMAFGPYFNKRFEPRYIEDNDYTLRIRLGGGKFVRAHAAQFWHFLGAVVKASPEKKKRYVENWNMNVGVFRETYGIGPHESQQLGKLGLELRQHVSADKIGEFIEDNGSAIVRVERRMGGIGDILFTTVIARELKKKFGENIRIDYAVPAEFISILENNFSYIDDVFDCTDGSLLDFFIDLTDLEYRVELHEMIEHNKIVRSRTEIYLDVLGLEGKLKPDYSVTEEEKEWAEEQWRLVGQGLKRVVLVTKGSNKMKEWPHMVELLEELLENPDCVVNVLDSPSNKYRYSFCEAAAVVATADLVISPDSGISNLAGILNIPVVTIFSNRDGEMFKKMFESMIVVQGHCPHQERDYCEFFAPCLGRGPHRPKELIRIPDCLSELTLEEVYGKVLKVLKKIKKRKTSRSWN